MREHTLVQGEQHAVSVLYPISLHFTLLPFSVTTLPLSSCTIFSMHLQFAHLSGYAAFVWSTVDSVVLENVCLVVGMYESCSISVPVSEVVL